MSYSQVLLSQHKILAFFTLDPSVSTNPDPLLHPTPYCALLYHYHYPVIYYQQLYQHFRHSLPPEIAPEHLRLVVGGRELPSEMPLGLWVQGSECDVQVMYDRNLKVKASFRVVKMAWKKAFEGINKDKKSDYVKSRMTREEEEALFRLYKEGHPHGLHRENHLPGNKYEGSFIMVRGIYQDLIIERKYPTDNSTMAEVVAKLFNLTQQQLDQNNMEVVSHGVPIDMGMSTRLFLDEWNYNDGFCYLLLRDKPA